MSDLIINIRFLMYHFQVSRKWVFSFVYNEYHKDLKNGYFKVYTFNVFNLKKSTVK